jgi:hypothetical protein
MTVRTIVTRSQRAKCRNGNHGPGHYVAGVEHDGSFTSGTPLRADLASRRGWTFKYFGEYYWNRLGPRSMYHRAMTAALAWQKECPHD